jgi:Tfp pilus assembly protein PilF
MRSSHRTATRLALALLLLAATPVVAGAGELGAADPVHGDWTGHDGLLPSPFAASNEIRAVGVRISHLPGGVRDKADAVLDYIFDAERGLGFEYRSYPTRSAVEAFEARNGNCLSLVNLYLALARSAGLDAFPVEVEDFEMFTRRNGAVVRATHVVGGLWVNGVVYTVDFLPDKPKTYRRISRIADRRHAALFYNAVATEAMLDGDSERAETLFAEALRREPENAEAWNNYAVMAKRQGDLATARERFERSLASDAKFLPALNNLAALDRAEGRVDEAKVLESRALDQKRQSPYFLTEQALHRLSRGDLAGAQDMLVRARRIDREIPEIYLALGRIALARGDEAEAEHQFAEARKHSQELSDAFKQGVEHKISKLTLLAEAD